MKLRNKRSGEIGYFCFANWNDPVLIIVDNNGVQLAKYTSLAELNTEWEDYEEPKTFFTIYYDGTISEFKDGDDEQIRDMKEIGNYFDTREEAEKAVEKLKAWKRLKENGFRFIGLGNDRYGVKDIKYRIDPPTGFEENDDLDLLFGGGK